MAIRLAIDKGYQIVIDKLALSVPDYLSFDTCPATSSPRLPGKRISYRSWRGPTAKEVVHTAWLFVLRTRPKAISTGMNSGT